MLYPLIQYIINPSYYSSKYQERSCITNKENITSSLKTAFVCMLGAKYRKTYNFDKDDNMLIKYGILSFFGTYMRYVGQNLLFKLSDYYPSIAY